ncbi:MAG: MFS transporter [Gammaproteobacteria bacterium]|nr:MFS transporter [Gammaproteobacteria bacterium]
MDTTRPRRDMIVVTTSLTVAALIHGLSMPLLSLVLDHQGVDSWLIGVNTAVQYLSVFVVAPFAPRLMRTIGPAWMMLWSIAGMVVLLLLFPLFINFYAWTPLRFLLGMCGATLWISGEAWVNHTTAEHVRGRVIALYTMVTAGGFALGPLIVAITGSVGWTPFIASSAIIALAAVPLLWVLRDAPRLSGRPSGRLVAYVALAPAAMGVYLAFAMLDGILLTFLPLYGVAVGLTEATALTLMTLMAVGTIVFQWPIGWLADHMNRMALLVCSLALMFGLACGLPFVIAHTPWNAVYALLFGGVFGVLYTVPMVMLGHRFKGADLAAAATVFGVVFSVGSTIGPPLGGFGMEYIGPHGISVVIALIVLLALPWPVFAYIRRRLA